MLHTKYERSRLSGFREEDFLRFSYEKLISPRLLLFLARGHNFNKLGRRPLDDAAYKQEAKMASNRSPGELKM